MTRILTISEVEKMIAEAGLCFRHEECQTCECYLGYLTQLMIDSDQESQDFLKTQLPERDQIHSCLGCDPCPPGILHSNYIRKKTRETKK